MCKMVLKITKETWEKYNIKTVKHYNEEKHMIELWQKMSNIEEQTNYSNIADGVLRRIRKYCGKKTKSITEEEKQKYKAYFAGEKGIFIIEKFTCNVIERCELPETIELRKKLGYNHNNIMVRKETSIAEKTIKLFLHEDVAFNKRFNGRKPDIWFKKHDSTVEADEGNHEDYDTENEEERREMFNRHNFKIFHCNPNNPNFDLYKCLGEINAYNTKSCEKEAANLVIDKIIDDLEKVCIITKSKELKRCSKNILPNCKQLKTHDQK